MACSNVGTLCDKLVLSQSVTYSSGVVAINIPAGTYDNGEKYCIVVLQDIPSTTTIGSTVVITIGTDVTNTYPLVNSDCTNVTASQISKNTRYATVVATNIQSGVFKLLANKCSCKCCNKNNIDSLPI